MAWRVMVTAAVEPERLLFVDEECGLHTPRWRRALRLRGTERRAPQAFGTAKPYGKNTTLLSSMSIEGMGPSRWPYVKGLPPTARVFETYDDVEKVLVPSLRTGRIVVMDNLGAHRPKRIRELIEKQGCELLYLPSYSPEYTTP